MVSLFCKTFQDFKVIVPDSRWEKSNVENFQKLNIFLKGSDKIKQNISFG